MHMRVFSLFSSSYIVIVQTNLLSRKPIVNLYFQFFIQLIEGHNYVVLP